MAENIQFITHNVRGIQTMEKRRDYLVWLKKYNKHIIFLQETHTSSLDEIYFKNTWGHEMFFSHGTTKSKGLITIVPKDLLENSKLYYRDLDGRLLIIELKLNDNIYYLINVYAPSLNNETEKINFLLKLKNILTPLRNNNLILGGDWNIVLEPEMDKKGFNVETIKYAKAREIIKFLLEEFELIDCWRLHHPNKKQYTWRQKKPKSIL
jgi:exonuclease III